jgi:hypothetical protein
MYSTLFVEDSITHEKSLCIFSFVGLSVRSLLLSTTCAANCLLLLAMQ